MNQYQIVMLGHGEIGKAIESVLVPRHRVSFWERDLETWEENVPLEDLLDAGCDLILFAMPANPHREMAERVHAANGDAVPCLTIAKGLDQDGKTPASILASVFGESRRFGVLYGPMIGEDLLAGRPGFADVSSASDELINLVLAMFDESLLHLTASHDVVGASWAAILKNIYVPLIGAADGLELGDNIRGFLLAAALAELREIVFALGGTRESVYGMPGAGDLITTATSPGSHHRNAGMQLARGETGELQSHGVNIRGEGFHALRMLQEHKLIDIEAYPLLTAMERLVTEPANAREVLLALGAAGRPPQ